MVKSYTFAVLVNNMLKEKGSCFFFRLSVLANTTRCGDVCLSGSDQGSFVNTTSGIGTPTTTSEDTTFTKSTHYCQRQFFSRLHFKYNFLGTAKFKSF